MKCLDADCRGAGAGSAPRKLLPAGAQELNVPGGGPHFQGGTAAVQLAFRREALRAGQSPPSLVTRMSLKSDMILWPFARSMLARIVMATSGAM